MIMLESPRLKRLFLRKGIDVVEINHILDNIQYDLYTMNI